ncbi:MAG: hypothetical protein L0J08_04755 [Micrococcaceae bacterium]|nr:hypothetical protein [Micrococcaceae bacterium]
MSIWVLPMAAPKDKAATMGAYRSRRRIAAASSATSATMPEINGSWFKNERAAARAVSLSRKAVAPRRASSSACCPVAVRTKAQ